MKRNVSRILAVMMLYKYEITNEKEDIENINKLLAECADDEIDVDYDDKFMNELYDGVLNNIKKIDMIIARALDNYTVDRLSIVDRNILRVGTYELLFTKTPKNIVINEVVEISKTYSETNDLHSSKFNNGVIDKIAKIIEGARSNE